MYFYCEFPANLGFAEAGAVGSLAFALCNVSAGIIEFGSSVDGSYLTPNNAAGITISSSNAMVGVWRCLGRLPSTESGSRRVTLFQRIE
ncbi:hypothetical protein BV924_20280 [Pectobacterium odoriferum]|nr:hypothetical protein BV924_20280 [Pectobacterium odoriferum]POE28022.1 hypothetical protein BV919_20000 [Pectobacterium odoriferum]POE38484.1 hypothetical protein BV920_15920 [Pectobacterium odoriferum]